MMKISKIIVISLILLPCFTLFSSISAQDISNLNLTGEIDDSTDIISVEEEMNILSDGSCCEDETGPQTYYVAPDPENPNQVQAPTVQPTIDKAKSGDTIILNGTFEHCHFMINKTLTILATPETSVGVCPHHTHMMKYGIGPETKGVFYISPEANGTVISGFSFTNDFYYIANNVYNPFGVYVDANDVTIDNLTFNWVGVKKESTNFNPEDFLFDAIVLNNTQNTTINNIVLGNVNSFIKSINAVDVNTNNISVVENKIKEQLTSVIATSNLSIKVSDNANLQLTLKDANNNPLSNREVIVIFDGEYRNLKTDNNGIAKLNVKYASSGIHYAALVFAGDEGYKSCFTTVKITVTKKSSSISAPKVTLKVKKSKTVKITLKSGSKAISGKKITIKVNGKTFSAKTNSKGVASVKVKVSKKGNFKYAAKFAGDNAYNSVSKTGKIIVKK